MLLEALFTIVRQPKCPSIHEWVKEMWYGMEYYSAIKKILPFATTWMDLEGIILSQIRTNTNVESKKKKKMNKLNKTETDLQVQRTNWWSPEVGSGWQNR